MSSRARVYVGNLPSRATERDVEHFFRGYGRIKELMLKNGFGFVEFDDSRDAEDAVHDLNGRDMLGERVIVEPSRRGPRGRDAGGYGGGGGGGGRFGPPIQTRYRLLVFNLSSRCTWQDLKDMMRRHVEVTYAEAHNRARNEANVCFASREDMRRAMDKFQGKEINGRRIKLVEENEGGGGGSGGRRDRSRSRGSGGRRDRSRSRSRSPRSRSRSRSTGGSRTPPAKEEKRRSRSRSKSRSKSRSS